MSNPPVSKMMRSRCSIMKAVAWDGDKVSDKVDAVWPEKASDGEFHYFPCVIESFRGKNCALEACVQWDDHGLFEKTTWLSLDQIRDRKVYSRGSTLATKSVVKRIKGAYPGQGNGGTRDLQEQQRLLEQL